MTRPHRRTGNLLVQLASGPDGIGINFERAGTPCHFSSSLPCQVHRGFAHRVRCATCAQRLMPGVRGSPGKTCRLPLRLVGAIRMCLNPQSLDAPCILHPALRIASTEIAYADQRELHSSCTFSSSTAVICHLSQTFCATVNCSLILVSTLLAAHMTHVTPARLLGSAPPSPAVIIIPTLLPKSPHSVASALHVTIPALVRTFRLSLRRLVPDSRPNHLWAGSDCHLPL